MCVSLSDPSYKNKVALKKVTPAIGVILYVLKYAALMFFKIYFTVFVHVKLLRKIFYK